MDDPSTAVLRGCACSLPSDAERRRIERRLHDGVQQHLVAIAVNLQLARDLVGSDDGCRDDLLDEISRDLHEALDTCELWPRRSIRRARGPRSRRRAARRRGRAAAESR